MANTASVAVVSRSFGYLPVWANEGLAELYSTFESHGRSAVIGEPIMEHLAWLAWEEWGDRAPEHLLGDWAFAAWDGRRRQLLLARDPLGNTGLYYFSQPPLFAFCSDPEGLLALPVVERAIRLLDAGR